MASSAPQITNTKLLDLVKTYWAWRRLWMATTMAFAAFGLLYVLVLKKDRWTASQGLIVRDEANGAVMRLGRFQSQTEMKAAQETILEMARNTQVLREALLEIGPTQSMFSFGAMNQNWPSQREVSELADESIGVRAPKGAEFGTTEVIYLDIKQESRQRALDLNRAVCKALDNRLRQVRMARAEGVINELVRASNMATEELRKATEQLQIVEREAGADLADLRGLTESNGSGNTSRQLLDTVKTELRQLENQHALLQTDCALLRDTQVDPQRLLSAPASILNAHPGLKKLREGLADAQLATSQLRGRFTSAHPLVSVATTSENEIKVQLQAELALALSTAEKDVENSLARMENLKRQQRQLEERLERLARIRADHANLNQEVRSRTTILQDVERQLADARAARDAASSTSLLTRIDEPVLGERPVGPGRSTILAGMTLAGLCFGLGIVFLLTPLDGETPNVERWNERLGRRLSDRFPWLADQSAANAPRRRRSDVDRRQSGAQPGNRSAYFTRRQTDRQEMPNESKSTMAGMATTDPIVAPSVVASLPPSLLASVLPTAAGSTGHDRGDATAATTADARDAIKVTLESLMAEGFDIRGTSDSATSRGDQVDEFSSTSDAASNQHATSQYATSAVATGADATMIDQGPMAAPASLSTLMLEPRSDAAAQEEASQAEPKPEFKSELRPDTNPVSPSMNQSRPVAAPVIPASLPPALPTETAKPSVDFTALSNMAPTRPGVLAATTESVQPPASSNPPTKPRPARNMFRPNQASAPDVKPASGRGSAVHQTGSTPAPMSAPMPAPVQPAPINAFETPMEGGLAGIGMPTQRIPDLFSK